MSNFSVDVLTPSSVLAKDLPADSLLVPATGGQFNILPHHTHVIEKLGNGILTITNSGSDLHFTVTNGICKVQDGKVVILSTVSESPENIDKDRAEKALSLAKKKLTGTDGHLPVNEQVKYQRKFERAEMRLKALLLNRGR